MARGGLSPSTNHTYDTEGNLTDVEFTEGNVATARTETARDFADGRYRETLANAVGHEETLTYDARFGLVKTLTDPNNRTTTLKYDAFGRETGRTTPDQVVITTAYESCADSGVDCAAVAGAGTDASVTPVMRIKETSPIAPATWRYLDKLGRTIRTETEGFALNTRVRRDTRYDARGRVERASQPHYSNETAHYREYTYDIRGRVLSETRPDGGVTTMRYTVDPEDRNRIKATATEQVYQRGRMGTPTKVATRETVSLYNVMGELVSRTEGANEPRTTDTATVSIAYNGAGQPTTYTAAGAVTKHLYDSAGFRERLASPDFGRVTFEYNKFGELRERADGKGTTTWKYDVLGRPKTREDPDGVAEWRYDPMYAKGALGSRCYHKDPDDTECPARPADRDFNEVLQYDKKARLRRMETTIKARGKTYAHAYTYYSDGRLKTVAYPSGLTALYGYNERGYLSKVMDQATSAALELREAMDAHGNVTRTTYGNGVATTRAFDPRTGRPTGIDTTSRGGTKIQDNAYVWRSDGLLASRASHVGGRNAKLEEFFHDPLGRLDGAVTKLNGSGFTTRKLSWTYDNRGNLKSKASSVNADIGTTVSAYHYDDDARPNRLSRATIGGREHAIHHDADGNVTRYECEAATGCGDDTHIQWNGRNLPVRITLGDAEAKNPKARDEFAYGPDGARYHRKTTFPDGASPRMEDTYYAGAYEELLPAPGSEYASIEQTRVTDAVRHVRTTAVKTTNGKKTTVTRMYVDYLHKDHLGSAEGATGADGGRTRELAHDPYGGRRKADWTAALTESERLALAGSSDPRTRGHTGHEHLDRANLIHRGGRVYDPTLGRFLSPDPLVGNPGSAQSWNGYSYVSNSPMSYADPSGLSQRPVGCGVGGLRCQGQGAAGGGLGLASVVSTHRFQWVDIFFSVASISSWIAEAWNSGSGIIYNYSGGGVGDGGWGYDSPAPFFGIAYYSMTFQVTSQIGVENTPGITREPMSAKGVQVETSVDGDSHRYVITARICKRSAICNEEWANRVYDHVNKNDVPFSWDDEGDGEKGLLLGTQPIYHEEFPSLQRSVNTTREGHVFHPGEVTHEVLFGEDGYLQYVVTGTGSGGIPSLNNAMGVLTFRPGAADVLDRFGHPPRERGPPYPYGP